MTTTTNDQERAAYIAGDMRTADLLARIADLEHAAHTLLGTLEVLGGDLDAGITKAMDQLREVLP